MSDQGLQLFSASIGILLVVYSVWIVMLADMRTRAEIDELIEDADRLIARIEWERDLSRRAPYDCDCGYPPDWSIPDTQPGLTRRVREFTGSQTPVTECHHQHQLQGTGAIFYQSTGLLSCSLCGGWQLIRKPIK